MSHTTEDREQALIASYSFSVPKLKREVTETHVKWHLRGGGFEHILMTDTNGTEPKFMELARLLDSADYSMPVTPEDRPRIERSEEVKTREEGTNDPTFTKAVEVFGRRMSRMLRDQSETMPEELKDVGSIYIRDWWGSAEVKTPTRLGAGEHERRKAFVEAFLSERGIEFTTDCKVELSSNVCKPVGKEKLAAARAELSKDLIVDQVTE